MLDQQNTHYLRSLSIHITYLVDIIWIHLLQGKVMCQSVLGLKGFREKKIHEETMRHKRITLPFCASDDGNNSKNKSMLNCKYCF